VRSRRSRDVRRGRGGVRRRGPRRHRHLGVQALADDEANILLLDRSGLGVSNCIPAIPSILPLAIPGMEGPPDPAERIEALCASMGRLAAYRPASVLCLTGPIGEREPEEAYASWSTDATGRRRGPRGRGPSRARADPRVRVARVVVPLDDREAIELLDEAGSTTSA